MIPVPRPLQGQTSPGGHSEVPYSAACCEHRAAVRGVTDQPVRRPSRTAPSPSATAPSCGRPRHRPTAASASEEPGKHYLPGRWMFGTVTRSGCLLADTPHSPRPASPAARCACPRALAVELMPFSAPRSPDG